MEICGTGEGDIWVGYRPQLGSASNIYQFPSSRGYTMDQWKSRPNHFPPWAEVGQPPDGIENTERLAQVGSVDVLPVVRAIEAIIKSLQSPPQVFRMNVITCEERHLFLAEWLCHDGDGVDAETSGKSYGLHTCILCNKARFLCLDCASSPITTAPRRNAKHTSA